MEFIEVALQNEPIFFVVGSASTLFFSLSLLLMLIGGSGGYDTEMDADGSTELDADLDFGGAESVTTSPQLPEVVTADPGHTHLDSTLSFKVFSTQSILAFLMGFGWSGLAAKIDWGLPSLLAFPLALVVGAVFMLITAWLLAQMYRLNHVVERNVFSLIGHSGKAYTSIPGEGEGQGQIQIDFHNGLRTLPAKCLGEPVSAFEEVEVVGVERDSKILVVRKK